MQQFSITKNYLKGCAGLLIILLTSIHVYSQVFPVDTLMRNGHRNNRINIAYMADGYQSTELGTFITNSTTINNKMFSESPFVQYQNFFNSFTIKVPSTQSGAIHLRTAPDCPPLASQPIDSPATYFQSTFDQFSIHRLLIPQNSAGINSVLASNLPDYDMAFVVVNSPYYGGSGGSFPTASTEINSAEVAFHEIGHSFGGLADEYWAGDIFAAEKPNMTANNDPATVKWKNWIGLNGIGIYFIDTATGGTAWYRPHQGCKMQFLGQPFCSVCTERLIDRIHELVNMPDTILPASTSFTLSNTNPVDFTVTAVQNNPSTVGVKWYLNGSATPFATNQFNVTVPYDSLNNGSNTVRAEVIDSTALSKSYLPGIGYVNNVTWTVTKLSSLPVVLKTFTGKIDNHMGILNWEVDTPDDLQSFELEKSKDGVSFLSMVNINGQPKKKNYSYTDPDLLVPYSYYRLKVIEKNGASFYGAVIRLQNAFDKFYYKVYQLSDAKRYHLSVRLTNTQKISMQIFDGNGRRIMRKDFGNVETQLESDFNLAGKPAGIYHMNLNIDNKNYIIQLLAK